MDANDGLVAAAKALPAAAATLAVFFLDRFMKDNESHKARQEAHAAKHDAKLDKILDLVCDLRAEVAGLKARVGSLEGMEQVPASHTFVPHADPSHAPAGHA